MLDTLWQSAAAFFIPLLAYWGNNADGSSLGDLGVVVLVNVHLAMDVFRWYWITSAAIWGSIIATFVCVMVIDILPFLPGYWAFFHITKMELFWVCLHLTTIGALLPRFAMKVSAQYSGHNDLQIAREVEKETQETYKHK